MTKKLTPSMNGRLEVQSSVFPIYKGGQVQVKNSLLYSQNLSKISVTNIKSSKIEVELKENDEISTFSINSTKLILSTSTELKFYEIKSLAVLRILKLNRIIKIKAFDDFVFCLGSDRALYMICLDKYEITKCCNFKNVAYSLEAVRIKNGFDIFFGDCEGNVFCYNTITKKTIHKHQNHNKFVVGMVFDKYLFSIDTDGSVVKYNIISSETEIMKADFPLKSIFIKNEEIFIGGQNEEVLVLNFDLKILRNLKILQSKDAEFEITNILSNENLICVSNCCEFFFLDEKYKTECVIVGDNDEITDINKVENKLFIASNSKRIKCREDFEYEKGAKYACRAILMEGHEDSVMSLSSYKSYLLSSSRDKKVILWKDERVLGSVSTHTESVNSCAISAEIFASVGKDQTLQIFRYNNENIENIFTQMVHSKEINCVQICHSKKLIGTGSQDRTAKIFDFYGKQISILKGHKRGIWSLAFGSSIVSTTSADMTIRIWSLDSFSCIKVLEGHNSSVLKSLIFNNDKQLASCGSDGIIKIWDIKKQACLTTLNIHKQRIWAIYHDKALIYTGCSDGSIKILKDESKEFYEKKKVEEKDKKERELKISKHLENKDFLNVVELTYNTLDISNRKEMESFLNLVSNCFDAKVNEDQLFKIFEVNLDVFFGVLEKISGKSKNIEIFNWLVKCAFDRSWHLKKQNRTEKIFNDLEKQYKVVEDTYINLLSCDLLFRNRM